MAVLLAGDIGGTKTILRLIQSDSPSGTEGGTSSGSLALPTQTTLHEHTYSSQEFNDLAPMVYQFLAEANSQLGRPFSPEKACFGIAGPVVGNTSQLTNLSWFLETTRLEAELGIPQISLINDFAAVGYGVLGLSSQDLYTLQEAESNPMAPIAVIGAGTGLGEGFLVPHAGRYQVFGSEGGHTDFAPRTELEFHLLRYLLGKCQIDRVSVERVVSGQGIVSIYEFLRDRDTTQESPEMTTLYKTWQRELGEEEKTVDLAAIISQNAIERKDYLCTETMRLFISAYGAEAGNLALKLLPYGGLYIAGGIAAKNLPLMQSGGFMASFLQKGRVSPLLHNVPVHIVLNPRVGLIGSALYAALS